MNGIESYKGRKLDPARPVRIYRNLHKKGVVYSVQQGGLVIGYTRDILLLAAQPLVSAAGRERVRATGRKVVHAFIEGVVALGCEDPIANDLRLRGRKATYNPYLYRTFVDRETEVPLTTRLFSVRVNADGVTYVA